MGNELFLRWNMMLFWRLIRGGKNRGEICLKGIARTRVLPGFTTLGRRMNLRSSLWRRSRTQRFYRAPNSA
jgi:hypothetical protein